MCLPGFELARRSLGDVERDRHRPERAVGEPHVGDDPVVVRLGHEAVERREAAVHQQLEVAELARREVPGRKVARLELELRRTFGGDVELGDRHEIGGRHLVTLTLKLDTAGVISRPARVSAAALIFCGSAARPQVSAVSVNFLRRCRGLHAPAAGVRGPQLSPLRQKAGQEEHDGGKRHKQQRNAEQLGEKKGITPLNVSRIGTPGAAS